MTPEERNLVVELFDRLATLEDAERDPEAERLIKDGLRQAPNAPYALVQTVLVQDEALKRADARIRELEGAPEAQLPARDTSFLGGVRDSLLGRREGRGSVPSVRPAEAAPGMSPAWRTGAPAQAPVPPAMGAPGAGGGSFLGTAAAAAAGMIGGSLLLDGIRSMMGRPGAAHAAFDPTAGSPWGGAGAGGELARQAGVDDIGRTPPDASGTDGGRDYGLLGDSRGDDIAGDQGFADDQQADDYDDGDDDGLDYDDDGGSDV
ncbi:MAG TPA: DUF2076 domain-containing protein [Xanthobacteraceae bacterium]|jgi:hypothetical protein